MRAGCRAAGVLRRAFASHWYNHRCVDYRLTDDGLQIRQRLLLEDAEFTWAGVFYGFDEDSDPRPPPIASKLWVGSMTW